MPSADSPVFVIGCPRSGTTLLTLMLSSHSRIAIPPETRFLLEVFRERRRFGDLTARRNRRRLGWALTRQRGTKFRHLGLPRKPVMQAVVAGPPTMGSAIGAVYRTYAGSQGKPRWGDKRPSYFRHVEVLRELWPDAQFVHLVRDARDSAASLRQMRWWPHGFHGAVATWVHSVDCARRAQRRLPPDAFLEVRYEDLVAAPREQLERLCTFLGEDFEEGMLAPHLLADDLPRRQRDDWHANTRQRVGTNRVGAYRGVLSDAEVALVEQVAGSRLRTLGYAVDGDPRAAARDVTAVKWSLLGMRARTRALTVWDWWLSRPGGSVADRG
jgi:hypothetical protein